MWDVRVHILNILGFIEFSRSRISNIGSFTPYQNFAKHISTSFSHHGNHQLITFFFQNLSNSRKLPLYNCARFPPQSINAHVKVEKNRQ